MSSARGEHGRGSGIPVDLREDGVLYAINKEVFHPLGFALGLNTGEGPSFILLGDGSEPWEFEDRPGEVTNAERGQAFQALLNKAREKTA